MVSLWLYMLPKGQCNQTFRKVILAIDSNEAKQVLSDFDLEIVMTSKGI